MREDCFYLTEIKPGFLVLPSNDDIIFCCKNCKYLLFQLIWEIIYSFYFIPLFVDELEYLSLVIYFHARSNNLSKLIASRPKIRYLFALPNSQSRIYACCWRPTKPGYWL